MNLLILTDDYFIRFSYLTTFASIIRECKRGRNSVQDGKLFGRGSTDDKGPVIAWINALEVLQKCKIPIPVNLKVTTFACSSNLVLRMLIVGFRVSAGADSLMAAVTVVR